MIAFVYNFKAEKGFLLALIYHLFQLYFNGNLNDFIKNHLRVLVNRLKATRKNYDKIPHKKEAISPNYQILALIMLKQIFIPIFFTTGSHIVICIDQNYTVDEMKYYIMKKLEIPTGRISPHFLGIYQITRKPNESSVSNVLLNGDENVWEIVASWDKERHFFPSNKGSQPIFIFMLKVRFPFEFAQTDTLSLHLIFSQCYFEYIVQHMRFTEDQNCQLAALIKFLLKEELDIKNYFPLCYFDQMSLPETLKTLDKFDQKCFALKDQLSKLEIKSQFIQKFRDYTSLYLTIRVQAHLAIEENQQRSEAQHVVVAMNDRSLQVLLGKTSKVSHEILYTDIILTRYDSKGVIFQTREKTYIFLTNQGRQISWHIALAIKMHLHMKSADPPRTDHKESVEQS